MSLFDILRNAKDNKEMSDIMRNAIEKALDDVDKAEKELDKEYEENEENVSYETLENNLNELSKLKDEIKSLRNDIQSSVTKAKALDINEISPDDALANLMGIGKDK